MKWDHQFAFSGYKMQLWQEPYKENPIKCVTVMKPGKTLFQHFEL